MIIEIASITLLPEHTEQVLRQASDQAQENTIQHLPGFLHRNLVHVKDQEYADIVYWRSREEADSAVQQAMASSGCQAYFSLMDMQNMDMTEGVSYYRSVAQYSSKPYQAQLLDKS